MTSTALRPKVKNNIRRKDHSMEGKSAFEDIAEYNTARNLIEQTERKRAWDYPFQQAATELEKKASYIVEKVRQHDQAHIYAPATYANGKRRYAGGPYLENLDLINSTRLLNIAQHMPKGAHLHIHYNTGLEPRYLVKHARNIEAMWIATTLPLTSDRNMKTTEIQFQVRKPPQATQQGNPFAADYAAMTWMRYQEFQANFPGGTPACEAWIIGRMTFTEEQTHGQRQTVTGIWDEFAINTRMVKGLFAYESAFRDYTRALVKSFVADKISYAELRPNFPSNLLQKDDASGTVDNAGMCQIIIDEVAAAKANLDKNEYFQGVKIIYCAPKLPLTRAWDMEANLNECIKLKQQFPDLICGFDLVGPEETMQPISLYVELLLAFKQNCKKLGLDIPFMFHAGETLQNGGQTDGNLFDALLLDCKRIGHGFALVQHPELMERYKKRNIAVELCPVGNEILHLCPTIGGHALNALLANGVHCTVNCDNSIFYSSTLSHDFYQLMMASSYQSLLGWKTLCAWSLQHSCLTKGELDEVVGRWKEDWDAFLEWIVAAHPVEHQHWKYENEKE